MKLRQFSRGAGSIARAPGLVATGASVVGGALLAGSGYLHYHLWQSLGYRHIPIIGTLFVLQAITGVVLALVVVAVRRAWAALLGAGFSASTVAGLVISIDHGLFGFRDSWSAPFARETFVIELGAVLLLAGSAALWLFAPSTSSPH